MNWLRLLEILDGAAPDWPRTGPAQAGSGSQLGVLLLGVLCSPGRRMKRAVLTLLLLTLAASVAGTPGEAVQSATPLDSDEAGAPSALGASQRTRVWNPAVGANGGGAPSGAVGDMLFVAAPALRHGTWAYANPSHGSRYLAIPEGPGWNVTVCGPLGCLDRVSTDAGPELWLQRAGRIGDLAAVMFEEICGPLSRGLCSGSYTITGRADQHPEDPPEHPDDARMRLEDGGPTLPPTSTED